jgi:YVTN family beta-propeller protein
VTNNGNATVTRVDAGTDRTRTVQVGYSPIGVAHAGRAVWVPNQDDGTVSRIDTATLRVTTLTVGGAPGWTAYDGPSVWIGNDADHVVERIDAESDRVVARVPLNTTSNINDGDALGGRVYFPTFDGTVHVIDERTNRETGAYRTGLDYVAGVAAYAGRLWLVDYRGTALEELDPTRMR